MILRYLDVTVDRCCDNMVALVFAGDLFPLNMYQTAVHRGQRLEFAPIKRVEQPEFSKEEGTEGAPTSRDAGDDQLSEYDDDSYDNDSDDFAVEEDGAIRDMQNSEICFGAIVECPGPAIKNEVYHYSWYSYSMRCK